MLGIYCVVLYGLSLLLFCERLRVSVCAIAFVRFVCGLSCDVVWFVCVLLFVCVRTCVELNVFVCFMCALLVDVVWFSVCVIVFV